MFEVIFFDSSTGLEIGTFDVPATELVVGEVWEEMRFVAITKSGQGSDYDAVVEWI